MVVKNELIEYLTEQIKLLQDGGQVLIKDGDIAIAEGNGNNPYLIDTRTRKGDSHNNYIIKPIGIDERGYLGYICHDCGQLHWVHKSNVSRNNPMMTGCCKKKSHSKRLLLTDNKLVRVKCEKIYIDYE